MSRPLRLLAALRGSLYAAGFILLWWWVVAAVTRSEPDTGIPWLHWLRLPGLLLLICGASIAIWCIAAFALVGKGTPAPFDAPREFVGVGPYRFVRNPMYLGAMAVIAGAGLMLRSPRALAVTLAFFLLAHLFVLLYEEPTLERRFGESYRRYKASVNRWLPGRPVRLPGPERRAMM